ncbi:unnamed protein product [Linum trigynum]|uniref:Uncharacterized protein n=1 Tax=Linum trigynum TaxID=586398 RepID=A0AAV2G6X8_9ROSI
MDSHGGSGKASPYMALPPGDESTATPKIYEPSSHRFMTATSPDQKADEKKTTTKKKKKKKKGCFLMCFSNMEIHSKEEQDKVLELLEDGNNNKCCFLMCFSNLGLGSPEDPQAVKPTKY